MGGEVPADAASFEFEDTVKKDIDGVLLVGGLLRNKSKGSENPVAFLLPENWNGRVAIWLGQKGKNSIFSDGSIDPDVKRLTDAGVSIASIDLFRQGEFLPPTAAQVKETRRVRNPREAAAYTFGYNRALCAHRVHDVLDLIGFVRSHKRKPKEVWLVAVDGCGHIAAAATARAGDALTGACIDTGAFRFASVPSIRHPDFLPGGSRYGDLPGMLVMAAPRPLWLAGESTTSIAGVLRSYRRAGAEDRLTLAGAADTNHAQQAVAWLLNQETTQ